MKGLVNIDDAAGFLGLSPWTVRLYVRNNTLAHVKIGRRVLIEIEELERFVNSCKAAQPERIDSAQTCVMPVMKPK
jgi:excisionase family DNA binding protein